MRSGLCGTVVAVLLLVSPLLAGAVYLHPQINSSLYVIIYGDISCPHCYRTMLFMRSHNISYTFCELSPSNNSSPCMKHYLFLAKNIGIEAVPVSVIVYNNTLAGIIVGEIRSTDTITKLRYNSTYAEVAVITPSGMPELMGWFRKTPYTEYIIWRWITNTTLPSNANSTTPAPAQEPGIHTSASEEHSNHTASALLLLPALMGFAILDAFSPCAMTAYLPVILSSAKRKALFILALYWAYVALGLLMRNIAVIVPKPVVVALLLLLGGLTTWRGLSGNKCSDRIVYRVLDTGPVILAFVLMAVMIPCTAGTYLVAASLLSHGSLALYLLGVMLYTAAFIAPIATLLLLGEVKTAKKVLERYSKDISAIVGGAVIGYAIYMLLFH